MVITVFFKWNFHCNLKWRSKILYTIWGAENFFWVIFLGEKYVEKISANLGGVGCTTLLTWRGITQKCNDKIIRTYWFNQSKGKKKKTHVWGIWYHLKTHLNTIANICAYSRTNANQVYITWTHTWIEDSSNKYIIIARAHTHTLHRKFFLTVIVKQRLLQTTTKKKI